MRERIIELSDIEISILSMHVHNVTDHFPFYLLYYEATERQCH